MVNKVSALLGGVTAEQSEQIAPIAQENKAILVGAAGSIGLPVAESPVYALGISTIARARFAGQFLAETLKVDKVALVLDRPSRNDIAGAEEFARLWSHRKLPLHEQRLTEAEAKELNLPQALAESPTVFIGRLADARRYRAAQLGKSTNPQPFVFIVDDEGDPDLLETARTDPSFFWLTAWTVATKDAAGFRQRFEEKFKTPATVDAVIAYECARFLFAAAADAKSLAEARLAPRLDTFTLADTVTGDITMTKRHVAEMPTFVMHVIEGKAEVRQKFDPVPVKPQ
jgi:ABC-type branched-subunit amino acid transport system substrate-binding protein